MAKREMQYKYKSNLSTRRPSDNKKKKFRLIKKYMADYKILYRRGSNELSGL